jgi:hypothetical protein
MSSSLAQQLVRAPIEKTVPTSTSLPFLLDYSNRRHFYLFSLSNLDLKVGEYGTVHLPASTWFELPFSQGTKITPYNQAVNVLVKTLATDELLNYIPVEAFNLNNLSSAAINVPVLPPIDTQYFEMLSLQLMGPFVGTILFQGTNDDTLGHFQSADAIQLGNVAQGIISQTSAIGIYLIPTPFRYVQAQVTAYTSGLIQANAEFYRVRKFFFQPNFVTFAKGSLHDIAFDGPFSTTTTLTTFTHTLGAVPDVVIPVRGHSSSTAGDITYESTTLTSTTYQLQSSVALTGVMVLSIKF